MDLDKTTMRRRPGQAAAYAMLCAVMVFWAGNAIVGRAVRNEVGPFTLAFVRWAGALCAIAPFAIRPLARDWPALRRRWPFVLLLGLVGVGAFNALLYSGLRYTTATNGLLLQALIPPFVLVFAWILSRQRATAAQVAGVALSTVGVAAIVFRGDLAALAGLRFGFGDGLVLCAVVAWAFYTALLPFKPVVHPLSLLAATFVVGVVAMAPLAAGESAVEPALTWRPVVIGAFVYVAVFPSALAYFLYNEAVGAIGAGAAGQTISLLPVFGAGLASALLHEPLQGYHLAGIALIAGGIGLGAVSASRRRAAETIAG